MKFLKLIILALFSLNLGQTFCSDTPKNFKDFYLTAKRWAKLSDFKNPNAIKNEIKQKLNIDLESSDVLVAVDLTMINPHTKTINISKEVGVPTFGVKELLDFIPKWLPVKYFFNESLFGAITIKHQIRNTKEIPSRIDLGVYLSRQLIWKLYNIGFPVGSDFKTNNVRKINLNFMMVEDGYVGFWLVHINKHDIYTTNYNHENDVTKHYKFVESKELEQAYKNYRKRTQSGISKLFKKF